MFDWGQESQMQSYTDVALRSTRQKAYKMKVGAVAICVVGLLAAGMACGGGEAPASGGPASSEEATAVSAPGSEAAAEPWTRQFGPGMARSVAVDATGNVYVAGYTHISAGPGQPWRRDAFLRKYDRVGTPLWSREFGSMVATAIDEAASVAVDLEGNIYVAGITLGALRGQASAGDKDAFVRKYDTSGVELWTRQFGSPEADRALGVAVDEIGNVYVAGTTFGALPGQVGAGPNDAFLRKYGTGGDEVWTRQFGSPESDSASGVAVDGEGNVYVAGWTGGALPDQVSAGMEDAFLRTYSPEGTVLWTRQFGHPDSSDGANGLAVDVEGNVYMAGYTNTADRGDRNAFLRKYDPAGGERWSRLGEGFNSGFSVVVAEEGNVYVAGSTTDRKVLGDALLRKYDPTGEELWTRQFGSPQDDLGFSVAVDREGGVYVAGYTQGAMPGQSYSGMRDAFVIRLTQ